MTLSLSYIQAGGKTIGMEITIVIPEGYYLEGLSMVRPEEFWRCALRTKPRHKSDVGLFYAPVGRTPQEAVDKAVEELERQKTRDLSEVKTKPTKTTLTVDDLDF